MDIPNKHFKSVSRSLFLLVISVLFSGGLANYSKAQNAVIPKLKINDVEYDMVRTPQFSNIEGLNIKLRKVKEKEWLAVTVSFELEEPKTSNAELQRQFSVVDALKFNYYVLFDGSGALKRQVFTGSVNHVNIPTGEELLSSMYFSPSALMRIFGLNANVSKSKVKMVGVEVEFQGQIIARYTGKGSNPWWLAAGAQKVPGLMSNKSESPFLILFWDLYAEIESNNRR